MNIEEGENNSRMREVKSMNRMVISHGDNLQTLRQLK